MKPCPECGSSEIYRYKKHIPSPGASMGESLLPALGSILFAAKIIPYVCHGCGYIRIFASEQAREKVKTSKHWEPVE